MRVLFALAALALSACATAEPPAAPTTPAATQTAWIVGADGRAIGQASFLEAPGGVLIRLEFSERALPPGWHGVHIHTHGTCSDAAQGFQAAGGHVGMNSRIRHGLMSPQGSEPGDLPNLFAPPAGVFGAEFFSTRLTLGPVVRNRREPLLDADGSALMVHANPDDQVTQPIGGAGPRVGCAALTQLP